MFRKKEKKKVGGAEMTQTSYCQFSSLGRDRVSWLCVVTWFSVSRHSSQAAEGSWVATGVFLVAIELPSSHFLSRQGSSLCRDNVLFSVMTMSQ